MQLELPLADTVQTDYSLGSLVYRSLNGGSKLIILHLDIVVIYGLVEKNGPLYKVDSAETLLVLDYERFVDEDNLTLFLVGLVRT